MSLKKKHFLPKHGGFLEVLKIALPLILSNSCHAMNMFVDRLMLAQHSASAVSASFTGGLTSFTVACLLFGTVVYTGTFVAQYEGAGHRERIGSAVWQGIWLALAGGILLATGIFWSKPLFEAFGHEPAITADEILYFQLMSAGGFIMLTSAVLPCFWTGRGKTDFVLLVSAIITLCNIPLNYLLIFGFRGLPALGIAGAAIGTICAELIGVVIYMCFFLAPSARRHFETFRFRIDFELIRRMLRYGLPNGINLAMDLLAFNTFGLLLGCYGTAVHEATSITFGINNIAFCPVIGVGMTAAILTGQAVGAENIPLARKSVRSCLYLVVLYNILMVLLFTVFQNFVLAPFIRTDDPSQEEAIRLAGQMLLFISGYLFADGVNLVFSNALRGAGDTKFTMYAMTFVGIFLLAGPCIVLYKVFHTPWWSLWVALVAEILILCVIFSIRYLQGKWTKMRVIELPAENDPDGVRI